MPAQMTAGLADDGPGRGTPSRFRKVGTLAWAAMSLSPTNPLPPGDPDGVAASAPTSLAAPPAAAPSFPPDRRRPPRARRLVTLVAALAAAAVGGGIVGTRIAGGGTTAASSSPHLSVASTTPVSGVAGSVVAVAAKVTPAVATIVASGAGQSGQTSLGSGFVVSSSGHVSYVLTNDHVVDGASQLVVIMPTGKSFAGTVVGTDPLDDLAVVSIPVSGLLTVTFGSSSDVQLGEAVVAIGSPLGNEDSVTAGVISALHRTITAGDGSGRSAETLSDVLQTDAAINPGNSGGPLVDMAGRVIGVNVATSSAGTNLSFSIPSDRARVVAQALIAHTPVDHPFLGIGFETPLEAAEAGRPFSGPGVRVVQVLARSPAASAGFAVGDLLISIDGVPIDAQHTVGSLILQHHVGDLVHAQVERNGLSLTLTARLEERPATA